MHASFSLFFFFQGCQPLLFKDLTLALQSNKNLLVNWLGSANFSGFSCNSLLKVQYSTRSLWKVDKWVFLSLVSDPKASCWSRCKVSLGFSYRGSFAVDCSSATCYLTRLCFQELVAVAHLASLTVFGMRTFLLKWMWRVRWRKERWRVKFPLFLHSLF